MEKKQEEVQKNDSTKTDSAQSKTKRQRPEK